jgi:hypothetical protein
VPTVAGNSTTEVWVAYGNDPNSANQDQPTSVWQDTDEATWHLSGTGGSADSTAHANNLDVVSGVTDYAGLVGTSLNFDGVDDELEAPNTASLIMAGGNAFSLSVLCQFDALPSAGNPAFTLAGNYGGSGQGYYGGFDVAYAWDGSNRLLWATALGTLGADPSTVGPSATWVDPTLSADTPYLISGRLSGDVLDLLLNGVVVATASAGSGFTLGASDRTKFNIGNMGQPFNGTEYGRNLDGKIGEVRVSSRAKSDDWFKAEYVAMTGTTPGDGWLTWSAAEANAGGKPYYYRTFVAGV